MKVTAPLKLAPRAGAEAMAGQIDQVTPEVARQNRAPPFGGRSAVSTLTSNEQTLDPRLVRPANDCL
jgi:hypothetical protein